MRKHIAAIIASAVALSVTHTSDRTALASCSTEIEQVGQGKRAGEDAEVHLPDASRGHNRSSGKLSEMRDETRAGEREETPNVQRRKGAWRPRRFTRSTPNVQFANIAMHDTNAHGARRARRARARHEMQMEMHSTIDLADPMSREGSGTSWIPDSSPMYGRMFMFGENMLMLHGAIFPRYTNVSTRRGDDRIDAPNWFMAMFSHPLGDSAQFGSRLMMSLDPLTEGGRGYPLLFQTGEAWNGEPLHDRQHPHDLFDELSFSLSQKFEHDLSAYIYFGYPGEPALGPPAFMHRPSAMDDPDAPIGHHWQDSTHITFGVATLGAQWRNVKLEGSIFTGREPDEDRYDFDRPRFDSYSGRLSWNPTRNLALQVSYGYIKSPEELHPETKIHRTTASAIYNLPLGHDTNWSNTLCLGPEQRH